DRGEREGEHGDNPGLERDAATDAEGDGLNGQEAYWNQRITYPTGNYNPAWLRAAAAADSAVARGVPADLSSDVAAGRLSSTSATARGPQPEHMTNCGNCF